MSDVQVAQLMSTIAICRRLSTEQRRCGGFKIVDDVDELRLSNEASQARKICSRWSRLGSSAPGLRSMTGRTLFQ